MTINLITEQEYKILHEIYSQYPSLTLENKGYEQIDLDSLSETEREKFKEVESILSKSIHNFVRFQNFKHGRKGEIRLRFQYAYSVSFTGVGYIELDELLNGFKKSDNI